MSRGMNLAVTVDVNDIVSPFVWVEMKKAPETVKSGVLQFGAN